MCVLGWVSAHRVSTGVRSHVIKPCPHLFTFQRARDHIMVGKEVLERSHDEEHVEVGLRKIVLHMDLFHQMHEGHVDEVPRYWILDLFDEVNRLIAVEKFTSHTHTPPG